MTITRIVRHPFVLRGLLPAVFILAMPAVVCAAQTGTQPVIKPVSSNAQLQAQTQFQQNVQQQQLSDQLQKSQLQQQLRQSVSDNAKRPVANNPRALQQLDQADQAQRDRDRAQQQDLIDQARDASATLPRVVPKALPAPARSGG